MSQRLQGSDHNGRGQSVFGLEVTEGTWVFMADELETFGGL